MLGLPINDEETSHNSVTSTKVISCIRFYNVPCINFAIITTLVAFLLKLTTKYKELYMKSSLITIIVTNLVLYGISESLAQTILSFKSRGPAFSIYLNGPIYMGGNNADLELGAAPNLGNEIALESNRDFDEENTDISEDDLNRFLDYLNDPTTGTTPISSTQVMGVRSVNGPTGVNGSGNPDEAYDPFSSRAFKPTYFNFYRLTGFMCWGFVMAFVQCWWYRFLQIYSKHPQFVEVLRKVMSDQFCFSPISLFCFFTYGTIVLENGTWDDAKAKLRKLYLQTLIINYSVWFPVQFINFLLVPRDFQVPFSSSISVLWNCFLSMRNSTA